MIAAVIPTTRPARNLVPAALAGVTAAVRVDAGELRPGGSLLVQPPPASKSTCEPALKRFLLLAGHIRGHKMFTVGRLATEVLWRR
jgi:hypothetical protein